MKILALEELIISHLTDYFTEKMGDLSPERVNSAYKQLLSDNKIDLDDQKIITEIITEVMRRWAYNTHKYDLPHSHLVDVPKSLFKSFKAGFVYAEDFEKLRDILFEAGLKEESELVSNKIAEMQDEDIFICQ